MLNNCEKYENLISLYLDDMLLATEVLELLEHLDSCENCHAYYTDLKSIKESIKNLKIEYPEDLTISILDKIQQNKEVQIVQYKPQRQAVYYGVLAACACMAIVISTSAFQTNEIDNTANATLLPRSNGSYAVTQDVDGNMIAENYMEGAEPMQAYSMDINSVHSEILLDEYAFVYEFIGYSDISGITQKILHMDDNVIYLEVENTMSSIESLITKLENYDYEYLVIDHNEFRINTESKSGIFIINKK